MGNINIIGKEENNFIVFDEFVIKSSIEPIFINCDLTICIAGFKKKQNLEIEMSEFNYFLKNLLLFNSFKINFIDFKQLDSIFDFKFVRDSGKISLKGIINSYPNIASLKFEFVIEQFIMDKIEKDITELVGNVSN